MLSIVPSEAPEQDDLKLDLDALVREGARRLLLAALKAEVDEYVAQHADHRDEAGHALVVRNGAGEPRKVMTAAGELEIQAPRVHDRREGRRFTRAILPPWARRSPKVTDVLPLSCPVHVHPRCARRHRQGGRLCAGAHRRNILSVLSEGPRRATGPTGVL
jgi:hypothetical protein